MQDKQPPTGLEATRDDIPDWWPYAAEFPHWHFWRGVSGLMYARRPRTSPPVVVRGEDTEDLRAQMRRAEERMTSLTGSDPGPTVKSLSGASSLGFMCIRAAGQPRGAWSVERSRTAVNCNPNCNPTGW